MKIVFQNEFYAEDENGETYLVDHIGNVLTKPARCCVKKLVCGVGVNDWKYAVKSSEGGIAPAYSCWGSMLNRCYDEKFKARHPTYDGVTVCEDWKNSFAVFFNNMRHRMNKGWQLDKDLLYYGNKEYNQRSCIFVPSWLNLLLLDSGSARGDLPQGVSWNKQNGKYLACCKVDGKLEYVGYFTNLEVASRAYVNFKIGYIESKREEIEGVAKQNNLHTQFSVGFSLTDRVIENFKKQTGEVND